MAHNYQGPSRKKKHLDISKLFFLFYSPFRALYYISVYLQTGITSK